MQSLPPEIIDYIEYSLPNTDLRNARQVSSAFNLPLTRNDENWRRYTSLSHVAWKGDITALENILASKNISSYELANALDAAVSAGNKEAVQVLIDAGAFTGYAIRIAFIMGRTDIANQLINGHY